MQQHGSKYFTLHLIPHPDPGGGDQKVKPQHFHNIVMFHFKLKRLSHAATWYELFLPAVPPPTQANGQNSTNQNMAMLHIKLNGIRNAETC